jgi:hypothetical protein
MSEKRQPLTPRQVRAAVPSSISFTIGTRYYAQSLNAGMITRHIRLLSARMRKPKRVYEQMSALHRIPEVCAVIAKREAA